MTRYIILFALLVSGSLYGFDDPATSDSNSSTFKLDRYQSVDRYQRSDRYHQADRYQRHDRYDNKTYSSKQPYQSGSSIYGRSSKSYQSGSSVYGRGSKLSSGSNKSADDKD